MDGIITVVDSKFCHINNTSTTPTHKEFSAQIALADVIVMNKIDLIDQQSLTKSLDCIRSINSSALLIKTSHGKVSLDSILDLHAYDTGHFHFENQNRNGTTHLDQSISTHTFEFKGTFNEQCFDRILEELLWLEQGTDREAHVLRLKGIVNFTEYPNYSFQIQAVYDMFDKYKLPTREESNKIIVIGQHLCTEKIDELFSKILAP